MKQIAQWKVWTLLLISFGAGNLIAARITIEGDEQKPDQQVSIDQPAVEYIAETPAAIVR